MYYDVHDWLYSASLNQLHLFSQSWHFIDQLVVQYNYPFLQLDPTSYEDLEVFEEGNHTKIILLIQKLEK